MSFPKRLICVMMPASKKWRRPIFWLISLVVWELRSFVMAVGANRFCMPVLAKRTWASGDSPASTATQPWSLGANDGDNFSGIIDEVQVSSIARSIILAADLILIYLVQNAPTLSTEMAAAVAGNTAIAKLRVAQPKFVRRTYRALGL